MNAKPLFLNSNEIQKIISGTKTQFRRIITPQPREIGDGIPYGDKELIGLPICPFGKKGDIFWIKETWCEASPEHRDHKGKRQAFYKAQITSDGEQIRKEYIKLGHDYKWKSPITMPRWASKLLIEIANVKVERLQDISPSDALAEGISIPRCGCEACLHSSKICPADASSAIEAFKADWGANWNENPWVWAVSVNKI